MTRLAAFIALMATPAMAHHEVVVAATGIGLLPLYILAATTGLLALRRVRNRLARLIRRRRS